ncbi:hypothetical protein [Tenacibaculum sp. nBUS_03]|uniref:hypothetical protein n=1 Tax=Tenacibaculum sp. nBUS_03 TaxID=3395320 RepID=UPI003EBE479B
MSGKNTNNKKEASVDTEVLTAQITQLEQEKKELTNKLEVSEAQVDNLNQENKDLKEQKEAVELEKEALEAKNTELSQENEQLKESAKPVIAQKVLTKEEYLKTRPTVKIDGQDFAFKFEAPETLKVKGIVQETSKLIKDEEIMSELVYGKSFYVEPVN